MELPLVMRSHARYMFRKLSCSLLLPKPLYDAKQELSRYILVMCLFFDGSLSWSEVAAIDSDLKRGGGDKRGHLPFCFVFLSVLPEQ